MIPESPENDVSGSKSSLLKNYYERFVTQIESYKQQKNSQ